MGRNKLKLEKQPANKQNERYTKRQPGIMKKSRELGTLCDVDVLVATISKKGKMDITLGRPNSNLKEVIAKYANATSEERYKCKLDSVQTLRKSFEKEEWDEVKAAELMMPWATPNSPPPSNKVDVTKEVEQAEAMLHQIQGAGGLVYMQNSIAGLEDTESLVFRFLDIIKQIEGKNNVIPTPAAGGNQVSMNCLMSSGGNGILSSSMLLPNIENANVDFKVASASTSVPPVPMRMPMPMSMSMREERSLLINSQPLVDPPMFNDVHVDPSTTASASSSLNQMMKGTNNTIPTPAAGGHQVAMNGMMGSGDNGDLRSFMLAPNMESANVFAVSASASASISVPPMPVPVETNFSMDLHPPVNLPMCNDIGTSNMYLDPSTSASASALASPHLMWMFKRDDFFWDKSIRDGYTDFGGVDDTNFGMEDNDNGLARGGGNAGAA